MDWKFETSGVDGQCKLFGVNIFDYAWQRTKKSIHIKDPLYGETHIFQIYCAEIGGKMQYFAAGEFSNGVWGFYTQSNKIEKELT